MRDNDYYPYYREQTHDAQTGKVHDRLPRQVYRWRIIAAISMFLALLFASTTLYLFFTRPAAPSSTFAPTPKGQPSQNQPMPMATSSQSTPASAGMQATPALSQSTPVNASSGTQTIPLNKALVCTTGCGPVHITITTATINTNTDQLMLNLSIDPGTAQGNYYFGNLDIQDQDGATYQPQGQLRDTVRFDLVPHQSLILAATYPFLPQSSSRYTLKTTMWSETPGMGEELFGDYQFQL